MYWMFRRRRDVRIGGKPDPLRSPRKASVVRPMPERRGLATIPVIGQQEAMQMDEHPILMCYDGSTEAQRAIDVAASVLRARRAVVLDVGPMLTTAESLAAVSSVVPGNAFEDLNTDDALQKARDGAERARLAGFDAEVRAELDEPTWQGIVDVADELDAAVIVLGSRALDGVHEVFEGSVSHDVAEHAGRPVLIVPPANGRH
jgi:nucleotide-binding universal stress UspA family protein